MGIETITRGAKRLYEERHLADSSTTLDKLVFTIDDTDTSAGFLLDDYISEPYAVGYRNKDNQSVVRNFQLGSGKLIEPPIASEKTPMDETLMDQIAVGVEPSASAMQSAIKNMDQILGDHVEAHNMTKNWQTMYLLRTGIFQALNVEGDDIGLNIDYSRDAANDLTADFSSVTIEQALEAMQEQLRDQGTPLDNMVFIGGNSWLTKFSDDAEIRELRKANNSNVIVTADMMPQQLRNTHGLYVVSQYRSPKMLAPVWICSFNPGTQYVPTKGATAVPWIPDTEAVMFSLNDRTWNVKRGINAFDNSGKATRVAGEIVVDAYYDNDPITTFIRSQTRHAFVYGNINHTVRSTGSNF